MVLLNSTTAFLIGGTQQGIEYTSHSYMLNTAASSQEWIQGPALNFARQQQSCGRIRTNSSSLQFSIFVVGGYNDTFMRSVEILDEGASEWRNGPDLPFGITDAALIEDHTGGVILVGGNSQDEQHLQKLFSLSDAGDESKWIEMPQKLKTGKSYHIAFLVPDQIASCSLQ